MAGGRQGVAGGRQGVAGELKALSSRVPLPFQKDTWGCLRRGTASAAPPGTQELTAPFQVAVMVSASSLAHRGAPWADPIEQFPWVPSWPTTLQSLQIQLPHTSSEAAHDPP